MALPGEIPQAIGRAYVKVLAGCAERSVSDFKQQYDLENEPDKLTFTGPSGQTYSFDTGGWYNPPDGGREVFIESKGHKDGTKVFEGYKEFLARAYLTSVLNQRHQKDLFWYLTNVPFASSIGRKLTAPSYIKTALSGISLLGRINVDDGHIERLSKLVSIGIFTDSFIRVMGITHFVRPRETLWSITKLIHGNSMPTPFFAPIESTVAYLNDLEDPNKIKSGQRLHIPWHGVDWDDSENLDV
jgi:hypothetical protein